MLGGALARLREAIAAGRKDFAHIPKDPDLAVLRDLPEFKALRSGLRRLFSFSRRLRDSPRSSNDAEQ
jgi:hypothetical protein